MANRQRLSFLFLIFLCSCDTIWAFVFDTAAPPARGESHLPLKTAQIGGGEVVGTELDVKASTTTIDMTGKQNNRPPVSMRNSATVKPTVEEISTIVEYQDIVAKETDHIVAVRFHAPWCRACKASQAAFRKLIREYIGQGKAVRFLEANADIGKGLGVPSLPYGHIYHPAVGLVEELNINRSVFPRFRERLKQYVDGEADVDYPEGDGGLSVVPAATSGTKE